MKQSRRQERLRAGEGNETIKETGEAEGSIVTEPNDQIWTQQKDSFAETFYESDSGHLNKGDDNKRSTLTINIQCASDLLCKTKLNVSW
ncbi:hypothetical protein EYF80_056415 [Liparis tanakae]|uniref:Uncharacterized protein n=1 Tax=Liparis tanakae TaxID=230148 RepID=A0A4Z2EXS9_9TELE|nr:hypothetical protein EYF80_056415 [Liparis tanakae]